MFTGIVECLGEVSNIEYDLNNVHFTISSSISKELKIDQSVSHNGVCLTVIRSDNSTHTVTAIKETLDKTNLKNWKLGSKVNLERCLKADGRFDGHIVQGHVDCTGICTQIEDEGGSWKFTFQYISEDITVEKGSITVNGTSLTVVNSKDRQFSVAIIPYTMENTVFGNLKVDDIVNLEFDIVGKYVAKMLQNRSGN